MGGAAEALLDELLTENKQQVVLLKAIAAKMGAATGGGGAGEADKNLKEAAKSAGLFSKALTSAGEMLGGAFHAAGMAAGMAFSALTKTGKVLYDNQMALSEGAIRGTNSLSSLYDGLENLPFGLGLVAKAMSYTAKVTQANVETYQKISDVGATLGGNLEEVRRSAKGMYLSLDEFANVMKANRGQLLNFGATAAEGANNLIRFNSTMIKGEVGRGLLGMGYSLEQANNMLGSYSEIMGGVSSKQVKDQKGMEHSVKGFAEELMLSAELEGKSREEKENELKERAKIGARENMMSQMNEQQKKAFLEAENRAGKVGGKGAQDALLSAMLGLPPMTKEAQTFAAVQAKANKEVVGMTGAIKSTTMTEKQRSDSINQSYGKAADAAVQTSKAYGKVGAALSFGTDGIAQSMNAGQKLEAEARNQGLNSAKDHQDRVEKIQKDIEKAEKSKAGEAAQAIGRAKFAGDLMDMLAKLLTPFFPIINGLIKAFETILPVVMNFGGKLINNIIIPALKAMFGGIKLTDVMKDITVVANTLYSAFLDISAFIVSDVLPTLLDIKEMLTPAFEFMIRVIKDDVVPPMKKLGTFIADNLVPILGGLAAGFVTYKAIMIGIQAWELAKNAKDMVMFGVSTAVTLAKTAAEIFATGGVMGLAGAAWAAVAPFLALAAPIIAVVAAVAAVVGLFVYLYKTGWTFGTAIDAIKDNLKSFMLLLKSGFLSLLDKITFGSTNTKIKAAQAEVEAEQKELAIKEKARDAERAIKEKERSSETKEAKRAETRDKIESITSPEKKVAATKGPKTPKTTVPAPPQPAAQKAAEEKKVSVKAEQDAAVKTSSDLTNAKDPMEILRVEMQALNKQTTEMIRYMREQLDATKALNKNLYPH